MNGDCEIPVLAGCAGEYREFRSAPALQRHFLCTWSNTLARDHEGPMAVVPDGCVDLVWIDGSLTVAGPDVFAAISTPAPGTTVTGIRFRPGAAATWLGLPMSEIVGCRVDLHDLRRARARQLAEQLGDAATPAEILERLQAGLGRLAPEIDPPAPEMELMFRSVGMQATGLTMANLLDRLDTSERSLRRRCHEAFGYGPKTLHRIRRFQRFLGLARRKDEKRLSDLACDAGYADQAHLTREVRRLSGLTPTAVLRQIAA